MEAKGQRRRGPGIGRLFMRQGDVEADGRRAAFERPAIGRLHDPWAAARRDHIISQRAGSGQGAAAHGHKWWELDVSWLTILAFEKLGLVTDVVRPRAWTKSDAH